MNFTRKFARLAEKKYNFLSILEISKWQFVGYEKIFSTANYTNQSNNIKTYF